MMGQGGAIIGQPLMCHEYHLTSASRDDMTAAIMVT